MNRRKRLQSRVPLLRGRPEPGTPTAPRKPLPRISEKRLEALRDGTAKPAARRKTGFSPAVKLAVRKRAGNGDPDEAQCEACGIWLGRYGGQVHHRVNRGAGGCADAVVNGCANASLLCGTSLTECHGLATALDRDMKRKGFVIEHGTTSEFDPRNVPVQLYGAGEKTFWLAEDGRYLTEAPEGVAA